MYRLVRENRRPPIGSTACLDMSAQGHKTAMSALGTYFVDALDLRSVHHHHVAVLHRHFKYCLVDFATARLRSGRELVAEAGLIVLGPEFHDRRRAKRQRRHCRAKLSLTIIVKLQVPNVSNETSYRRLTIQGNTYVDTVVLHEP